MQQVTAEVAAGRERSHGGPWEYIQPERPEPEVDVSMHLLDPAMGESHDSGLP